MPTLGPLLDKEIAAKTWHQNAIWCNQLKKPEHTSCSMVRLCSAAQSAGIHLFRVYSDDMNHIEEHIKQNILPKLIA
jgi:hypothetical protein